MRFSVQRLCLLIPLGLLSPIQSSWAQEIEPSQTLEGVTPHASDAWLKSAQDPAPKPEPAPAPKPQEEPKPKDKKSKDQEGSKKEAEKKGDDKDAKKEDGDKGAEHKDGDKDKDAEHKDGDKDNDKKDGDKEDGDKENKDKDKEEKKPEPLALAPDSSPVLFIKAETVILRPGKELKNAQVIVRNGRIASVGTDLQAPEGARVIEGKVVCAAFIDPWSTLGVDFRSRTDGSADASVSAVDALDPYAPDRSRKEALHAGVTLVETHIATRSAFSGNGLIMRTNPAASQDDLLVSESSAMWARLERSGDVISRVNEVDDLIKRLDSGLDYLKSWREYEKKLTEWNTEITELEEKLEKDFKKAKKDRAKDLKKAKESGKELKEKRHKEPKPPRKPRMDHAKQALGDVAEGRVPLVVMATRASVLRNLLEATKGMSSLRLIIAGGDQAMHVAPQLAARNIPVMVWPADPLSASPKPSSTQGTLALAGDLARAGIPVLIGSGEGGNTAALPFYAALAVGYGMPADHALAAITTRVASAFDISSQVGQVRSGRQAELLVLTGDPLSVGTQVQFVVSGGEVVVEPKE